MVQGTWHSHVRWYMPCTGGAKRRLVQGNNIIQLMWHVYIIQCRDKTLYTGTTTDIPCRVAEHNHRKGGNYTRTRVPAKLVYQESLPNRSEALKREIQIKRLPREKKLALIHYSDLRKRSCGRGGEALDKNGI